MEGLGIDGRIILKWTLNKWDVGGMDWIDLTSDGNWWRTRVNTVMNLQVP
jgi:hypothetical protein